ncbi:hypothetical protein P4H65_06755 [Paenibacillus chitinolyticus]|uniref:hypothetical protein n=1 Tax=Paenibacillus chitinolyticus TaxID=79263 RepID=UPI002DBCF9FD|nr:hypothetical protein [Paenibacillus chitinolyticus]MEC0245491.1 hypothetical protein [Paenibacillus chitinolyticus]
MNSTSAAAAAASFQRFFRPFGSFAADSAAVTTEPLKSSSSELIESMTSSVKAAGSTFG